MVGTLYYDLRCHTLKDKVHRSNTTTNTSGNTTSKFILIHITI